jgi:hypothetical protein
MNKEPVQFPVIPNPVLLERADRREAFKSLRFKHVIPRTPTGDPLGPRITFAAITCPYAGYLVVAPCFCQETDAKHGLATRQKGREITQRRLAILLSESKARSVNMDTDPIKSILDSTPELGSIKGLVSPPIAHVLCYVSPNGRLINGVTTFAGVVFTRADTRMPPHHIFLCYCYVTLAILRTLKADSRTMTPGRYHAPSWVLSQPVLKEFLVDYRFHAARSSERCLEKQKKALISDACEAEEKIPIDELDINRGTASAEGSNSAILNTAREETTPEQIEEGH